MSDKGKSEGALRSAVRLEEQAFLELICTTDYLSRRMAPILKAEDLSSTQYNVLRILRGSPDGLVCGEIGNRMITRDPDITRLLDRMEKRALILRWRDGKDRRLVKARITEDGLERLARLDEPVREGHRQQLGHLGRERLEVLSALLRDCRMKSD